MYILVEVFYIKDGLTKGMVKCFIKKTKMKNATNIGDWMEHWDNFDYQLYLMILKAKQR